MYLSEKLPACEPMKFSSLPVEELIGGEWGELHLIQVQEEKIWSTSTPINFMDTSMLFSKQQQRDGLPLASYKMGFFFNFPVQDIFMRFPGDQQITS